MIKAARLHAKESEFRIDEIEIPDPKPGEVRVKLNRAFVPPFILDITDPESDWILPARPFCPGFDSIGIVESVGENVLHLTPGQRVYCDVYYQSPNVNKKNDHCFLSNFGFYEESRELLARWPAGAFSQQCILPAECIIPIDKDIATTDSTLCRLGWLGTALRAFKKVNFQAGQDIAINGATGVLGSGAVLLALAMGANKVYALGRRESALKELSELDSRVIAANSLPENVSIDCALTCITGQDSTSTEAMMASLKFGGQFAAVASTAEPLSLPLGWFIEHEIKLYGVMWFARSDITQLLSMIKSNVLDLSVIQTKEFPLEKINDAIKYVSNRTNAFEQVVICC